ncbi:5960_t:CDS:2 [Entrophospora sp. SA101]|nr:5960_t:CDS:2 [Entrophospora sp. SA101]
MAVSIYHCRVLIYLEVFTNFLYRETLAAFLLWRLKQIEYSAWDRWISFALFTFRTVLNPILDSDEYLQECKSDSEIARYIQLGYISIDVLIDFFVTVRLVQILNEGNRNSAQANSIIVAFDRNNLSIVSFRKFIMSTPSTSREMEEGERDSLKSIKPSSFTSISTSNSSSQTSGSKSQKHKSWRRDSLNRQQKTASFRLNKNKFVVVSMQRLTFFEWANLIISDDKKENIRSSDEVLGLLDNCDPPAMVHISQSRRGSSTSTIMSHSTSQTKINDQFSTDRADVWPIRPFASASLSNNRGRKIVVLYRKSQSGSPAMYKILSSFNKIEDALPEDKEEQQDSDSP